MQAVIDKIMEAKSVAVLTHLNEDPDTIGSCFAFAKVMRKLGKEATVYVNGRIESRLAFIGDDYVLYQEGMKHISVSMPSRAYTSFLRYPFKNLGFMRFPEPVFAGIYQNILTTAVFRAC